MFELRLPHFLSSQRAQEAVRAKVAIIALKKANVALEFSGSFTYDDSVTKECDYISKLSPHCY